MLVSKENHAWIVEEESKTTIEESKPMKETFNVKLVEGDSSKVTKIGGELQSHLKENIINFLKGNKAVMEEVGKLLTAGFIHEVYYPEWLVNVFMVKKKIQRKMEDVCGFCRPEKCMSKGQLSSPRID